MAEPIISTAEPIFTYENVKNNKEIRDQWRNYILQKFSDKARWRLLTQILGDSSTLQIDKLTPESFDKINKIFGAPAIYDNRSIDTTPLRPPLMQKSVQQTPDNQKDFVPAVEPATQNDKTDKPVVVAGGQPQKADNKNKPGNGTYATADIPKGGTKTIGYGYDLNPGTDVTADVMKAVKADGNTSFANWRQSLVNQGWDGDPSKIKYDPSTGKFMYNVSGQAVKSAGKPALDQQPQKARKNNKPGKKPSMSDAEIDAFLNEELGGDTTGNGTYASARVAKGGTYASPSISSGGTYATGEGIKDANGNVLTNPGGNADYQYALRDPSYGLYVRDRLTDAQKEYLQAVLDGMGYNYDR